jgi:adenosylcobyric acid synthase
MLGEEIRDPNSVECGLPSIRGMGLLPCETVFEPAKVRTRVEASVTGGPFDGAKLDCYEIHMGTTAVRGDAFCRLENGQLDGCQRGNVFGTYLHGLFDSGELVEKLASWLCARKGLTVETAACESRAAYKERQYDALAAGLRASLDMEALYHVLEREGVDA